MAVFSHNCDSSTMLRGRGEVRRPKIAVAIAGGGFGFQGVRLLRTVPDECELVIGATEEMYEKLRDVEFLKREGLAGLSFRLHKLACQRSLSSPSLATALWRFSAGLWTSLRMLLQDRPEAVVAVAAPVSVPLFMVAKCLGIKRVFVDSLTRVSKPSITAHLIDRLHLADRLYVQWPEATDLYRRAEYEGRLA